MPKLPLGRFNAAQAVGAAAPHTILTHHTTGGPRTCGIGSGERCPHAPAHAPTHELTHSILKHHHHPASHVPSLPIYSLPPITASSILSCTCTDTHPHTLLFVPLTAISALRTSAMLLSHSLSAPAPHPLLPFNPASHFSFRLSSVCAALGTSLAHQHATLPLRLPTPSHTYSPSNHSLDTTGSRKLKAMLSSKASSFSGSLNTNMTCTNAPCPPMPAQCKQEV